MSPPTYGVIHELSAQAVEMLQHNPPCPIPNVNGHNPHLNHCERPNLHTGQPNRRCLGCEYRWVLGITSSKRVRDTVKTMSGSPGDPTGEFAVNRSEIEDAEGRTRRRDLERRLSRVRDALTQVIAQRDALESLAESFVGRSAPQDRYAAKTTMLMPGELEASYAAKEQRESRGEGWGSG